MPATSGGHRRDNPRASGARCKGVLKQNVKMAQILPPGITVKPTSTMRGHTVSPRSRASRRSAPICPMRSRGVSAGQLRHHHLTDIMAVETGDRHVLRDRQPLPLALEGRADRRVIVGAEDTVDLRIIALRRGSSSPPAE